LLFICSRNKRFGELLNDIRVVNLDIPDDDQSMDPDLVEMLQDGVERAIAED
jgi:predicted protein tyrosine phosphatase